jgi:hypothetical protein
MDVSIIIHSMTYMPDPKLTHIIKKKATKKNQQQNKKDVTSLPV